MSVTAVVNTHPATMGEYSLTLLKLCAANYGNLSDITVNGMIAATSAMVQAENLFKPLPNLVRLVAFKTLKRGLADAGIDIPNAAFDRVLRGVVRTFFPNKDPAVVLLHNIAAKIPVTHSEDSVDSVNTADAADSADGEASTGVPAKVNEVPMVPNVSKVSEVSPADVAALAAKLTEALEAHLAKVTKAPANEEVTLMDPVATLVPPPSTRFYDATPREPSKLAHAICADDLETIDEHGESLCSVSVDTCDVPASVHNLRFMIAPNPARPLPTPPTTPSIHHFLRFKIVPNPGRPLPTPPTTPRIHDFLHFKIVPNPGRPLPTPPTTPPRTTTTSSTSTASSPTATPSIRRPAATPSAFAFGTTPYRVLPAWHLEADYFARRDRTRDRPASLVGHYPGDGDERSWYSGSVVSSVCGSEIEQVEVEADAQSESGSEAESAPVGLDMEEDWEGGSDAGSDTSTASDIATVGPCPPLAQRSPRLHSRMHKHSHSWSSSGSDWTLLITPNGTPPASCPGSPLRSSAVLPVTPTTPATPTSPASPASPTTALLAVSLERRNRPLPPLPIAPPPLPPRRKSKVIPGMPLTPHEAALVPRPGPLARRLKPLSRRENAVVDVVLARGTL